jgi:hypothetical protein
MTPGTSVPGVFLHSPGSAEVPRHPFYLGMVDDWVTPSDPQTREFAFP